MLDEKALRRSTFQVDSVPVVLADGQEWKIPRPYVELFPRFEGGRLITVGEGTHFGEEFDGLMKTLADGAVEDSGVKFADYFPVAAFLLRWNYDLTDDALMLLLRHRLGDESSVERMGAVLDVALGRGPKASAAGDGSPAST